MTASRLKGYTVRARLVPAAAEPNGNTRRFYNYLDFFTAQTAKPTSRCESGSPLAAFCYERIRRRQAQQRQTLFHHYPHARPMTKEMPNKQVFSLVDTHTPRFAASDISRFPKLGRM